MNRQSWFRRFAGLLLLAVLLASGSSLMAQSNNANLIAYHEGDLWIWNPATNTTQQITEWGYNGGPVLSPDGTRIAYHSTASDYLERVENGTANTYAGATPANLWVMTTLDRDFTRIADQSGGATLRSIPSWSPDGTRLAWSELPGGTYGPNARLMIYDLQTGTQSVLNNQYPMGIQDGGIYMPPVNWGPGGIARMLYTYVTGIQDMQMILEIYDPVNGSKRSYTVGSTARPDEIIVAYRWVKHQGLHRIALMSSTGTWTLFDPATGNRTGMSGPPVMQLRGNNALQVIPVHTSTVNGWGIQWQVRYNGQIKATNHVTPGFPPGEPAISPDGTRIAWHDGASVVVWNATNGSSQTILRDDGVQIMRNPNPISVVWGTTEWVTPETALQPIAIPTPTYVPGTNCTLSPRLTVGDAFAITPGEPNNIRTAPSVNASRIGQMVALETGVVQEGPVCNDGYNWYRVSYASGTGWTAEGENGVYWLNPVNAVDECWNSPAARLTPGMAAYVLPGDPNVIRDVPGVGARSTVIGQIPADGVFTVTGYGVCANDGRRWYPISYNGQTGWTAEGEGSVYWIAPAG